MGDPFCQSHAHLCPHAVKEREEESHKRVKDVGVVEIDREERDGEV